MTIFISYSHIDNADGWVEQFALHLKGLGATVLFDHRRDPSGLVVRFITSAITNCRWALVICTPHYKQKADAGQGWIGSETGLLAVPRHSRKAFPILRSGKPEQSIPEWLAGHGYYDLGQNGTFLSPEHKRLEGDLGLGQVAHPNEQGQNNLVNYLRLFGRTWRLPDWDPDWLCDEKWLNSTRVRYIVQQNANPIKSTCHAEVSPWERREPITRLAEHVAGVPLGPTWISRLLRRVPWQEHWEGEHSVVALVGEPGSGKSTLAVQIAEYVAKCAMTNKTVPVPVYINLRHFTGNPDLDEFNALVAAAVESACPRKANPVECVARENRFRSVLDYERLLFIFDGLDEMPADRYCNRVDAVGAFIWKHLYHGRFLVTCRLTDFTQLRRPTYSFKMRRFDILPWPSSLAKQYAKRRLG